MRITKVNGVVCDFMLKDRNEQHAELLNVFCWQRIHMDLVIAMKNNGTYIVVLDQAAAGDNETESLMCH